MRIFVMSWAVLFLGAFSAFASKSTVATYSCKDRFNGKKIELLAITANYTTEFRLNGVDAGCESQGCLYISTLPNKKSAHSVDTENCKLAKEVISYN